MLYSESWAAGAMKFPFHKHFWKHDKLQIVFSQKLTGLISGKKLIKILLIRFTTVSSKVRVKKGRLYVLGRIVSFIIFYVAVEIIFKKIQVPIFFEF